MSTELIGFLLAALVGLSLGLLGGGGSILTVPILVYLLGFDPKTAIAMSLPIVGLASLVGVVSHWRAGNVWLRPALLFGLTAIAGAFAGARLAGLLSGAVQLVFLAVIMLAAALAMYRGGMTGITPGRSEPRLGLLLPAAAGVGLVTGLVGIGGGFLIVPSLVLFTGMPMRPAVGTSLLVIAMNAASGFAGYLGSVKVPWDFLLAFAAVAGIGVAAGSALVRYVPQARLKRVFALFLVAVSLFIVYQNRALLTAH